MTEQERITDPAVPPAVLGAKPIEKTALTKKSSKKKTTPKAADKKSPDKTAPQTDDEKRLARNAALREWRKKNADRHRAYMKAWAQKRKKDTAKTATPSPQKITSKKAAPPRE